MNIFSPNNLSAMDMESDVISLDRYTDDYLAGKLPSQDMDLDVERRAIPSPNFIGIHSLINHLKSFLDLDKRDIEENVVTLQDSTDSKDLSDPSVSVGMLLKCKRSCQGKFHECLHLGVEVTRCRGKWRQCVSKICSFLG